MSAATAQLQPRFVRRTALDENEYRVNFKQIDNDVIGALVSQEARAVTPQMSAIYLSLLAAPQHCWERDGVIHFAGEDRADGHITAWEQMRETAGVANSTLSKALAWMHQTGLIGYDARANGAGIRIFFNRASSSIRSRGPQKILQFPRTPSANAPAPTVGAGFKEKLSERIPENTFRASARETSPAVDDRSVAGQPESPPANLRLAAQRPAAPDASVVAALTRQVAEDLRSQMAAAVALETENIREWFLNHGLPKATRVAQRETYDLLRAHGLIAKKTGDVGRNAAAERGREEKGERESIAAFLSRAIESVERAGQAGNAALDAACLAAAGDLAELRERILAGEQIAPDDIDLDLNSIEERIDCAMREAAGPADLDLLLQSARTELRSYESQMEKQVFEESVRRRAGARLRERYGIPRLSLFYA
jgi:hypothetical protein